MFGLVDFSLAWFGLVKLGVIWLNVFVARAVCLARGPGVLPAVSAGTQPSHHQARGRYRPGLSGLHWSCNIVLVRCGWSCGRWRRARPAPRGSWWSRAGSSWRTTVSWTTYRSINSLSSTHHRFPLHTRVEAKSYWKLTAGPNAGGQRRRAGSVGHPAALGQAARGERSLHEAEPARQTSLCKDAGAHLIFIGWILRIHFDIYFWISKFIIIIISSNSNKPVERSRSILFQECSFEILLSRQSFPPSIMKFKIIMPCLLFSKPERFASFEVQ